MTYTKITHELRQLESMADRIWSLRDSDSITPEYLSQHDYQFSEGEVCQTNFSELLSEDGDLSNYSSQEDLLDALVTLARTPHYPQLEEGNYEEFSEMDPKVIKEVLKRIISSVYTGNPRNITYLQGLDGEELGDGNKFGYNPEDGTISGRFLGVGSAEPDPIEYTIDGDKIKYGTTKGEISMEVSK